MKKLTKAQLRKFVSKLPQLRGMNAEQWLQYATEEYEGRMPHLANAYYQMSERNARIRWTKNNYKKLEYTTDAIAQQLNTVSHKRDYREHYGNRRTKLINNLNRRSAAVGGEDRLVRERLLSDIVGVVSKQTKNRVAVELRGQYIPYTGDPSKEEKEEKKVSKKGKKKGVVKEVVATDGEDTSKKE